MIYSEILLKSIFIFMSRSVSEFSGFEDRSNLRFYGGKIVNKICLLFRLISSFIFDLKGKIKLLFYYKF